jgi:hypothetical protein
MLETMVMRSAGETLRGRPQTYRIETTGLRQLAEMPALKPIQKGNLTMSSPATQQPTPQLFFQTINSYQRTEALKAAIELEVFTAIGEGNSAVRKSLSGAKRQNAACASFATTCASWGFLRKTAGVTV